MSKIHSQVAIAAGAALTAAALTASYFTARGPTPLATQESEQLNDTFPEIEMSHNVLIGDVGGTNVRLQLVKLYHDDHSC